MDMKKKAFFYISSCVIKPGRVFRKIITPEENLKTKEKSLSELTAQHFKVSKSKRKKKKS